MMGNISKFKHKIAIKMIGKDSFIKRALTIANWILFNWDARKRIEHYGAAHPNKKYYLLRLPQKNEEGLLSLYVNTVHKIEWAVANGYIPYVDYEGESSQYHVDYEVNGTCNVWEYYFCQPSRLKRGEIYHMSNVLLDGWTFDDVIPKPAFKRPLPPIHNTEFGAFCREYCNIQQYILDEVQAYYEKHFAGKSTLGVFIRGTDYEALRPKDHPIQPSTEEVVAKVNEFIDKYDIDQVFVVTEDGTKYRQMKNSIHSLTFTSDNDFVEEYRNNDYVQYSMNTDPYQRGKNYLIRLLLLGRCDYLVSSITNGSQFAYDIKDGEYIDSYWFNIGLY